ncbi:hypothetical protein N7G274_002585 [Stereocaulon virgatum]|uniref:Apple domain-containing protein n=1 Tax=Stereocaulon virgatum TaxID=373712 RepID=A0ABR4AGD2_9LECA
MLPYLPLSWAIGLVVSLLCSPAVGLRPAINEIYRRDLFAAEREAETKLQKKDLICYEDTALQAFQNSPDAAVPFCSSYLGITDLSSTSMVTAKTTTFTFITSVIGTEGIPATVPSSTVSIIKTGSPMLRNRQAPQPVTPIATAASAIIASCTESPLNATVISIASSACSCLLLTTGVDEVLVTVTTTTTETVMDYAKITSINTVTDGVTTITYTILPSPLTITPPLILPTIPITPSNSSVPTPTLSPPLPGCPVDNGSTYITQGQTFKILCETNFEGPAAQGIIVPTLHSCISDCAAVNLGFSQIRCYAVSYAPFPPSGVSNCFFRTLNNSGHPFTDNNYISAILILPPSISLNTTSMLGPTAFPPASNSAGITISANSTFPTVIPNITISSLTPSISLNSTNATITSDPSFPTVPIPSFTFTNPNQNRTYPLPTGSYNISSYLPTVGKNSSLCALSTVTVTAANSITTVTEEIVATTLTSTVVTTSVMTILLPHSTKLL